MNTREARIPRAPPRLAISGRRRGALASDLRRIVRRDAAHQRRPHVPRRQPRGLRGLRSLERGPRRSATRRFRPRRRPLGVGVPPAWRAPPRSVRAAPPRRRGPRDRVQRDGSRDAVPPPRGAPRRERARRRGVRPARQRGALPPHRRDDLRGRVGHRRRLEDVVHERPHDGHARLRPRRGDRPTAVRLHRRQRGARSPRAT